MYRHSVSDKSHCATVIRMDESFLNDLLECSVCLEQLDSTSKVLPCQHTFCKQCLEDIVGCHKELRCPECRILVETKVDDLPCNILLIRLLEGMKSTAALKHPSPAGPTFTQAESTVFHSQKAAFPTNQWQHSQASDLRAHIKQVIQPLPCAKALYSYEAKRLGDLSFKKGDMIILRKRIDQNWYEGELNGKPGYLPATHVQIVVPLHFPLPQAKALYDFHSNNKDDKDCLNFIKGETVTLIRKIDANWAEGKIGERAGIFPISFVELNTAAKALMKLTNQQVTRSSPSMSSCEVQPSNDPVVPISACNMHPVSLPTGSVVQPSTLPSASSPSLALSTTNSPCLSSPILSSVAMNLHGPFSSASWQTPVSLSSTVGCHSANIQREHPPYIKHSASVSSNFRESPGHQNFPLSHPTTFQREQNLSSLNASSICNTPQIGYSSNYKRDHPVHVSPLSISYPDSNNQSFFQVSAHINNYHRDQNIPTLQASAISLGAKDLPSQYFTPIPSHADGYHGHNISRLSPSTLSSYDAIPAPDGFSQMPLHQSSYNDDHSKALTLDSTISESEDGAVCQTTDSNLETEDEHTSSLSDSCRVASRENSPAAQMFSPVSSATGGIEKEKERSSPLLSNVLPATDEATSVLSGNQREPTPTPQTFPANLPEDGTISQSYQKEKTALGSNHQLLQSVEHLQTFPTPASLVSSRSQVLYNSDTSPVGATSPTTLLMQTSETQSPEWEDQNETSNLERSEDIELDQTVLPCSQELTDASSPIANISRMSESNGIPSAQLYYLALYNYQPQKKDELELKRGELYIVNEKCQDGWFKGTSVKTGHSGVFPGNYVQIAKLSVVQSPLHGVSPTLTNNRPLSSTSLSGSQSNIQAVGNHKHLCTTSVKNTGNTTYAQVITDRTLAPNSVAIAVSNSTQPSLYSTEYISIKQNGPADSSFCNSIGISEKIQSVSSSSQLPWTSRSPILIAGGPVGLIQKVEVIAKPNPNMQLRTVQRPVQSLSSSASSSPLLPENSLKTASNNGSTDCLSSMGQLYVTQASSNLDSQVWPGCSQARRISRHSPLHSQSVLPSASASNPVAGLPATVSNLSVSSTSQNRTDKPKERKEKERVSLMKRLTKKKSKSPPPSTYSTDGSSLAESSSSQSCLPLVHVRSVSCPSEALGSQSALHKKSCSLDGNAAGVPRLSSRAKQPVPLIKERFRCIVPYPPNSDYELELKIGDIVYVHKKREDGWYKGTLQRTGRTGLFPASFVESF